MNRKITFLAGVCLLLTIVSVSAQDKTENFFGEWTLDLDKSELDERSRVEEMTMKVSKSVVDDRSLLTITKTTKRAKRDGERGLRGRFGRGRGGQIDGKNVETVNYDLSGKETKSDASRGRMIGKSTATIKHNENGTMTIIQKTEFDSPRGLIEIKRTETWELSDDGKTLTVSNEMQTPRGNRNSTMVFYKANQIRGGDVDTDFKDQRSLSTPTVKGTTDSVSPNRPAPPAVPKRINGGVVNGKALNLVVPKYPSEAREKGVKGSVNVRIVIGKNGQVIEAVAISGHDLLREAAEEAASNSEFAPTYLSGQAVEVTGVIVYNFK